MASGSSSSIHELCSSNVWTCGPPPPGVHCTTHTGTRGTRGAAVSSVASFSYNDKTFEVSTHKCMYVHAGVEIARGHRSNPVHFITVTDRKYKWLVDVTYHSHTSIAHGCFSMKRRRETQDEADGTKKQHVEYAPFQKCQRDLNHEHQTMSWPYFNTEKEGTKKVEPCWNAKFAMSLSTRSEAGKISVRNG